MNVAEYFNSMDYGPALEDDRFAREWLESHQSAFGHFIDGAQREPSKGGDAQRFDSLEPATGRRLASIANGDRGDVDAAVESAHNALSGWQEIGGHGRARHLYALARLVQRHTRLFAVLESLENGKPIRETRDIDVPLTARHFLYHAGWAQLQQSEFPDWQPVGVIGQIVPWNFPLLMLSWKIAPALAAGNCVVLKPAELTSLTALLFAELAAQAGLPPGVLNVVTGDGQTGAALVDHPRVAKIAFTGSTEVGRIIRMVTAGSKKSLTLELGGKSPFLVFDDADLDAAVEGVVDAIWFNQGQVCCAGSRLLVQESVEARFIEKLKRRMGSLRVGKSLDKSIDMGAIVDQVQLDRMTSLVEQGRREGCEIFQPTGVHLPEEGTFFPPTLVTRVAPTSVLAVEEIFGPVLVTMSFRTPDEAVALANHTRYGLAASVWSETIGRALDIAPRLKCGVVWVNATNLFDAAVGFGGYRESGFGREGGREGMYEYMKPRAWEGLPSRIKATEIAVAVGSSGPNVTSIDRTAKLYIGGKQVRADGGNSRKVFSQSGTLIGEVAEGNRKDIRNAVTAARNAKTWSTTTTHHRAQVIYYLAENLSARGEEFKTQLIARTGLREFDAKREVEESISRLFTYAAWADKFDGAVHSPPLHGVALAMNEPLGVIGIVCPDESPLLAFVSLIAPALAMGNRVVVVPSESCPLMSTDLYQVVETSDIPPGALNIVTGPSASLALTLAQHDDVDALWGFNGAEISTAIERESVGNLKRTFVDQGKLFDWHSSASEGLPFLRQATQVKNIWVPYGD